MEPITMVKLGTKLLPATIQAVQKIKKEWNKHEIEKELQESLKTALNSFLQILQ